MSADRGNETRENSPGARQTLVFLLVAASVGIPGLWLGGPVVGYFAFLLFGILFVAFFSGDKRRLFLVFYLLLAVGLLVGRLTYSKLTSQETTVQISNLPLIGSLLKHTTAKLGIAILAGSIGGALAVGLPLFLIIFISAEWMLALRETYDLDRKLAMKLLLYLALGKAPPSVIADGGEIKPKGPLDKFGAPGVVLVKPYNAVVLEQGGKISRIEGAGLVPLGKHEIVKAVVDLRPQGEGFKWEALTKDNVLLKGNGSVSFRIESWKEARERGDKGDFETKGFTGVISGPYQVYRRTLYRAVYRVGAGKNWRAQIAGMAGGQVGGAIRGFRVDQIFVVDEKKRVSMRKTALQKIIDQAKAGAAKAGHNWGVQVGGVNVVAIEMPEKVKRHFLELWEVKSQREIEIIRVEGEAQVLKKTTAARARAFSELEEVKSHALDVIIHQIIRALDHPHMSSTVAAKFITAMERLARNLIADDLTAARIIDVIERLSEEQLDRLLPPGDRKRLPGPLE